MKIQTKIFGEFEIEDDKVIEFPKGIIGFPDMTKFALLFDEEKKPEEKVKLKEEPEEKKEEESDKSST